MLLRPEVPFATRAALLAYLGWLLLDGGPVEEEGSPAYCLDPPGRDILATPREVARVVCADCKKLSILAARRALDDGLEVDLCYSVLGPPLEHMWIRINGVRVDPSVEAGMPLPDPAIYRGGVIVPVRRRR